MGLGYEASKKKALKIITILAVITVGEVLFALLGKGHLVGGFHVPAVFMGVVMVTLSAVKAYLIIYEFMHMKYEVPSMVKSVLLPMFLLLWGVIAFLWEGKYWLGSREKIEMRNDEVRYEESTTTGMIYHIGEAELPTN